VPSWWSRYDPNCFRLPIPGVRTGEQVTVTVEYFETLDYVEGNYMISLPLAFNSLGSQPMEKVVSIACSINAGCPNCVLGACTYPVMTAAKRPGTENGDVISLTADSSQRWVPR
jgi:hypothetical protein